jgi:hypothetical protein
MKATTKKGEGEKSLSYNMHVLHWYNQQIYYFETKNKQTSKRAKLKSIKFLLLG